MVVIQVYLFFCEAKFRNLGLNMVKTTLRAMSRRIRIRSAAQLWIEMNPDT